MAPPRCGSVFPSNSRGPRSYYGYTPGQLETILPWLALPPEDNSPHLPGRPAPASARHLAPGRVSMHVGLEWIVLVYHTRPLKEHRSRNGELMSLGAAVSLIPGNKKGAIKQELISPEWDSLTMSVREESLQVRWHTQVNISRVINTFTPKGLACRTGRKTWILYGNIHIRASTSQIHRDGRKLKFGCWAHNGILWWCSIELYSCNLSSPTMSPSKFNLEKEPQLDKSKKSDCGKVSKMLTGF